MLRSTRGVAREKREGKPAVLNLHLAIRPDATKGSSIQDSDCGTKELYFPRPGWQRRIIKSLLWIRVPRRDANIVLAGPIRDAKHP